MDSNEITVTIEKHLTSRFSVDLDDPGYSRTVNLWEEGFLDSLSAVEIVNYLEKTFKIRLPMDILFDETATSVDGMVAAVIKSKKPE